MGIRHQGTCGDQVRCAVILDFLEVGHLTGCCFDLTPLRAFLAASFPFPSIFPRYREQNYFLLPYQKILHSSFPSFFPISLKYYFLLFTFFFFYSSLFFSLSLSHLLHCLWVFYSPVFSLCGYFSLTLTARAINQPEFDIYWK
jgi:hypothetical protein